MSSTSAEPDVRDRVVQQHVPAVMMPQHTNFPPLEQNGHRFIVGADGLWIEVRRPWLHLVWPVATAPMPLPYGEVLSDEMGFAFDLGGAEFNRLLSKFQADARAAMPNECAAWFLWNETAEELQYVLLEASEASPGGITFTRPALPDWLHLAVDVHSHGAMAPFFSATDNEDDAGEVKLSYVLGHVGTDEEGWSARLCAHGLFITFDDEDTERIYRICRCCGCTDDNACPGGCSWVEDDLCSTCDLPANRR